MLSALATLTILTAAGCGGESRFVATEPAEGADVRIVLALASTGEKKIEALARDAPFTFPLAEPFAAGGRVRIYALHFTNAALAEAFPPLAGRGPEEVAAALAPSFGETGPGRYSFPEPLAVLRAELDADASGTVGYEEISLDRMLQDPDSTFALSLDAEIACAPGENQLRAFNRADPSRVCLFERRADCSWSSERSCDDLSRIFDRPLEDTSQLREARPSGLDVEPGGLRCTEVPELVLGESRSWVCPGATSSTFVSIQDVPKLSSGAPWAPALELTHEVGEAGLVAQAARGGLFAYALGSDIRLHHFEGGEQGMEVQPLRTPSGANAFTLYIPAVPTGAEVAVGNLVRMSANGIESNEDLVVVHGDRGTYVLVGNHGVSTSEYNPRAFYQTPIPIEPAELTLRGPVVVGPKTTIFGVVESGVAVLRVEGSAVRKFGETPAGSLELTAADEPNLHVVAKGSEERAVVWTREGKVYAFDATGALRLSDCTLEGDLLIAIEGPRIVRRPAGERFVLEVIDLAPLEDEPEGTRPSSCREARLSTRYLLPPSEEGAVGTISVEPSAYLPLGDRPMLAYSYGRSAGVLDLATGASQAVELPSALDRVVLFESFARNELWMMVSLQSSEQVQAIRVPLPEGLNR